MPLGQFANFVITEYSDKIERKIIVDVATKSTSDMDCLQFNVFNVRLNHADDKVTLEDVLDAAVEETCSLKEFIAAIHEHDGLPRE